MEVVHSCPDVRYWSKVVCCTISTHMSDLEVKVTDLERNLLDVLVKVFSQKCYSGELSCPVTALIVQVFC